MNLDRIADFSRSGRINPRTAVGMAATRLIDATGVAASAARLKAVRITRDHVFGSAALARRRTQPLSCSMGAMPLYRELLLLLPQKLTISSYMTDLTRRRAIPDAQWCRASSNITKIAFALLVPLRPTISTVREHLAQLKMKFEKLTRLAHAHLEQGHA